MKWLNRLIMPLIWVTVFSVSWIGSAFPQTNEEVVEQFFPERFIDEPGEPTSFKTSTFAVADLNGDGSSFIVAVYSNGIAGVVRVLGKIDGTFTVVDEPNLPALGGDFPQVQVQDLDSDERPEIIVSLSSASGPTGDWIFKWDGAKLDLISPTRTSFLGVIFTKLSDSSFLDIDSDGIIEIINPTGSGPGDPNETIGRGEFDVYRFDGQRYIFSTTLNFLDSFFRRTRAPFVEKSEFSVEDPGNSFILTIINGTLAGEGRVSNAVIRLNGVVIAGPKDFNQKVGKIVREVSVLQDNVVEVELRGNPGGEVTVTVEPLQN